MSADKEKQSSKTNDKELNDLLDSKSTSLLILVVYAETTQVFFKEIM